MNALDTLRETTAALADCKTLLELLARPGNPEDTCRAAAAQLVPVNDALALARETLTAATPAHNLAVHLFDLGCSINRLHSAVPAHKP